MFTPSRRFPGTGSGMSSTLAAAALSTKGDDIEDLEVEDVIEEPLPSNDKREAGVHESVMPFD